MVFAMHRRHRIPVDICDGRFFVNARIGMIASETRFSDPIPALIDTGAQVSVLPTPLFNDLYRKQGIDLRRNRLNRTRNLTTSTGNALADQYQGQIGLVGAKGILILPEDFSILAVPRSNNGEMNPSPNGSDELRGYLILGKDVLAVFSSRIRARYWIRRGGMSIPDSDCMKCVLSVRGKRFVSMRA